MSERLPAEITLTGLSLREARKLEKEYGGEVEMTGFLRWKFTLQGSMTAEAFDELKAKYGMSEQ